MNYVKSINIDGFWGYKNINVDFFHNTNFIIGENGTGKTTLINFLRASLDVDYMFLARSEFNTITIELYDENHQRTVTLKVKKIKKNDAINPFSELEYSIKDHKIGEEVVFPLMPHKRDLDGYRQFRKHSISEYVNRYINISWLPVNRKISNIELEYKKNKSQSDIDSRLDDVIFRISSYFNLLDKKSSSILDKYQESVFLSLLSDNSNIESINNDFDTNKKNDIPYDQRENEKYIITSIFQQFNLTPDLYKERVDEHFELLKLATKKAASKKSLSYNEIMSIVLNTRLKNLIKQWDVICGERERIIEPKILFMKILSELFIGKSISLDTTNNLIAYCYGSNKQLSIECLSSGEKQLLILLGEAVLQKGTPSTLIADEPEISLHINWQEKLVENILKLNNKSQIIFATHSPDIVSHFNNHIIKIGENN